MRPLMVSLSNHEPSLLLRQAQDERDAVRHKEPLMVSLSNHEPSLLLRQAQDERAEAASAGHLAGEGDQEEGNHENTHE